MAICAAVGEQLFLTGGKDSPVTRIVALDAEKRHCGREETPIDGTVRGVAVYAVFGNIAMLIDKGTALFHMAAAAEIACGGPFQHH